MQADLLSELRDIHGIDAVHWWPLALGWWLLIVFFIVMGCGLYALYVHRKRRAHRWQKQANQAFLEVKTKTDAKEKVLALSALLRRIAIQKYGRESCAGLHGEQWLQWLSQHDPAKFDWQQHGKSLLTGLYAPQVTLSDDEFTLLLKATKKWMK